jgi:hypothetical protein
MAIINYTDQLKYAGKGYLDAKMMPVESVDDLKNIPLNQRFEGFTVTVLNNGNPQDYWLVGGTTNKYWVPKTVSGNHSNLKLILNEGFLKLMDGDNQLGESIDLNNFFPEVPENPEQTTDLYISSVDYTTEDDNNNQGIFLCFTYSDETKKYLDMSQFLSKTYEAGSGIVIDGQVISLDSAIVGRIETLATVVEEHKVDIKDIKERLANISNILNQVNENSAKISENTAAIDENKTEISTLTERVNALSSAAEGSTPDGKTIGITDDEQKALYVKVLEKDGNILKVENHEGNSGLFASIPVFYEDEELNN